MERLSDAMRMRCTGKTRPVKSPGERGLYGPVEADQGRTPAMRTNDVRSPLDESSSHGATGSRYRIRRQAIRRPPHKRAAHKAAP